MELHVFYGPHNFLYVCAMLAEAYFVACSVKNVHFLVISTLFSLFLLGALLRKYFFTHCQWVFGSPIILSHLNIEVVPFDTLMHFPFDNICCPSKSIYQYTHTHFRTLSLSVSISLQTFKLKRKISIERSGRKKCRLLLVSEVVCRATEYAIGKWLYVESEGKVAHVRNALERKLEFNPIKTNMKWPIP